MQERKKSVRDRKGQKRLRDNEERNCKRKKRHVRDGRWEREGASR